MTDRQLSRLEDLISRLEGLRERGFDESSLLFATNHIRVRCSQCEALVINGLACHETGCPNNRKENDHASEDL